MLRKSFLFLIAAVALALVARPLSASVQIPGLYNTGVNNGGALLADGAVDPHYTITSAPPILAGATQAYTYADLSDVYAAYPGSWVGNQATSQWIGPALDIVGPSDPAWAGNYSYELTFDMTGLDPISAVITGKWSSDNGSQILLNNVATGFVIGSTGYKSLASFTINTGFVPGLNTLTFVVNNLGSNPPLDPNPTGLQVTDLQGTANVVPEATAIVAWSGLAMMAAGFAYCRRQRS